MDGWMDGRMDGWMDGFIDGWVDGGITTFCPTIQSLLTFIDRAD
jgi:hypothetical protein